MDQSHECVAEPGARALCAFIGFARLPVVACPWPGLSLRIGTLISGHL
jgi:hypothetical protein